MNAKKLWEIALGVITGVGGFLDAGAIATAAQAGAIFQFRLVWAVILGTICIIFLTEMAGRLGAVSHHPLPSVVRERFGINYQIWPLLAELFVDLLVLASELGGICIALQLVTGIHFHYWAIPVALFTWVALWYGTFDRLEHGIAVLGLITLSFVVGAFILHTPLVDLFKGLIPTVPHEERAHYGFLAVSTIGSIIAPYLMNFYSSGAVEDKWDESDLPVNKWTAGLGMSFGMVVQIGVLCVAAMVLAPQGIRVDRYEQAALTLTAPMGIWGFYLFAGSVAIACFVAALEVCLDSGYVMAQTFGWNWGENSRPRESARFHITYTIFLIPAALLILIGLDPLKLTLFSMALTALILPLVVLPFLVIMNDKKYMREHVNGWISNTAVFAIIIIAFILAAVSIPLEILGGS